MNVETAYEEISRELAPKDGKKDSSQSNRVPEDDLTPLSLWLKHELGSSIAKVTISKRASTTPAVLFGQVSASMRVVM